VDDEDEDAEGSEEEIPTLEQAKIDKRRKIEEEKKEREISPVPTKKPKGKGREVDPAAEKPKVPRRPPPKSSGRIRKPACQRCAKRGINCYEQEVMVSSVPIVACVGCANVKMKCLPCDNEAPAPPAPAPAPAPVVPTKRKASKKKTRPDPNTTEPATKKRKVVITPEAVGTSDDEETEVERPKKKRSAPAPVSTPTSKPVPSSSKKRRVEMPEVVDMSDADEYEVQPRRGRDSIADFQAYYGKSTILPLSLNGLIDLFLRYSPLQDRGEYQDHECLFHQHERDHRWDPGRRGNMVGEEYCGGRRGGCFEGEGGYTGGYHFGTGEEA
jgi:hypothetical protein